jgi:hypothetical protein
MSHQLLSHFYTHIRPLHLCFQEHILTEDDDADQKEFLEQTLVASSSSATIALGERPTGEETMFDVMDLVLLRLFKQGRSGKPKNVLALGYVRAS